MKDRSPIYHGCHPGEARALFTASLRRACRLASRRSRWIDPMICEAPLVPPPWRASTRNYDVPEIREPPLHGARPVLAATIQIVNYFRAYRERRAIGCMAGERLQSTGLPKSAAVCTYPNCRPRICAGPLTFLAARILAAGKPFSSRQSKRRKRFIKNWNSIYGAPIMANRDFHP